MVKEASARRPRIAGPTAFFTTETSSVGSCKPVVLRQSPCAEEIHPVPLHPMHCVIVATSDWPTPPPDEGEDGVEMIPVRLASRGALYKLAPCGLGAG